MKVESLIRTDKEDWSKLYHGYANFYKMPMNSDILDKFGIGSLTLILNFMR